MKITATCSGGLAGRSECYQLDTREHADGKALEALLEQLDFFGAAPPCGIGADLPRWDITVEDGARRHRVSFTEGGAGAAGWQTLLTQLRRNPV
jgi:hypothetical protein